MREEKGCSSRAQREHFFDSSSSVLQRQGTNTDGREEKEGKLDETLSESTLKTESGATRARTVSLR